MKYLINQIKWAWQRVCRGYDDRWRWSLCDSLAKVVSENLEWMKNNCVGCPDSLYDKSKPDEECHKWKEILETMKQGFDAFIEMEECQDVDKNEVLWKKYDRGMELFVKYFMALWD